MKGLHYELRTKTAASEKAGAYVKCLWKVNKTRAPGVGPGVSYGCYIKTSSRQYSHSPQHCDLVTTFEEVLMASEHLV